MDQRRDGISVRAAEEPKEDHGTSDPGQTDHHAKENLMNLLHAASSTASHNNSCQNHKKKAIVTCWGATLLRRHILHYLFRLLQQSINQKLQVMYRSGVLLWSIVAGLMGADGTRVRAVARRRGLPLPMPSLHEGCHSARPRPPSSSPFST